MGPQNKFGGGKEYGRDFELKLTFKVPIRIEGYALRNADQGLDPEEWTVDVYQTVGRIPIIIPPLLEVDR